MKCDNCKGHTYIIHIEKSYKKLCDKCHIEKHKREVKK